MLAVSKHYYRVHQYRDGPTIETLTFADEMKTALEKIMFGVPLIVLFSSSCRDSKIPTPDPPRSNVPFGSDIERVEQAAKLVKNPTEWVDPIHDPLTGPRVIFKGPPPIPDESFAYEIAEDGHHYAIAIERFGSIWRGTVAQLDVSIKHFYGSSKQQCLDRIQRQYRFKGRLRRHPSFM